MPVSVIAACIDIFACCFSRSNLCFFFPKAYCCWPKDRQAQDNNGNCNQPYDSRCVDADPADNTDLCYVNHAEGAKSTGSKASEGWTTFPFDDGSNQYSAEGPIHCRKYLFACCMTNW